MKRLPAILFTIIGAALTCSCGGLKKMPQRPPVEVTAAENLVPKNGILPITLEVNVPEEYRNLNNGIQIRPTIADTRSDRKLDLQPMVIEGPLNRIYNERMAIYKPVQGDSITYRKPYVKGSTKYLYETEIPYEEWFATSELDIILCGESNHKRVNLPLAEKKVEQEVTDYTPSICTKPAEKYWFWKKPACAQKIESGTDTGSATKVTFPIASTDLSQNEGKEAFEAYLSTILNHPEIKDYSIEVTIANSPEGTLGANAELGQERKAAVSEYLTSLHTDLEKVTWNLIDENWEDLARLLPSLELEHQEEILAAIDTIADVDQREIFIRDAYYRDWRKFRKELYPQLRLADLTVSATYKGKEDFFVEEDGFSFEENPEIEAWEYHAQLLEAVKDKDYARAATLADQIPNVGVPEKVLANKATVYLMNGRLEDARILLERIPDLENSKSNLGMIYLQQEKYDEAEEILDGMVSINAAVAKMYLGKFKEAADILSLLPASEAKATLQNYLKDALK